MKVYTRKGDAGETGLFGGSRISKSSLKVDAYGSIDEAAAFIGVARAFVENKEIKDILYMIQEKFLVVAAYLASDANGINKLKEKIEISDIEILEKYIDNYSKQLLPLYKFLIPGENIQSAVLHVARTVVRRSERRKLEYDLYYIKHHSLYLDMMIMFMTFKTVVFGKGR